MKKTHRNYKVSYPKLTPIYLYNETSPQAACRKAFKLWIKTGELSRQPPTSDDGGFQDVEVEIL